MINKLNTPILNKLGLAPTGGGIIVDPGEPSEGYPTLPTSARGSSNQATLAGATANVDAFTTPRGLDFGPKGPGRMRYVDGSVSSSGDGLTVATAYKTIQEAFTAAGEGDAIRIMPGVYPEEINAANFGSNPGTVTNPVTVAKIGTGVVEITGGDAPGGWTVCPDASTALGNPNFANIYYVDITASADVPDMADAILMENGFVASMVMEGENTNNTDSMLIPQHTSVWWDGDDVGSEISDLVKSGNSGVITLTSSQFETYAQGDLDGCTIQVNGVNNTYIAETITSHNAATGQIVFDNTGNVNWDNKQVSLRNVPALISAPGQWAARNTSGSTWRIYYWPWDADNIQDVRITQRNVCIDLNAAEHMHFFGITMTCAGGPPPNDGRTAQGMYSTQQNIYTRDNIIVEECHAYGHNIAGINLTAIDGARMYDCTCEYIINGRAADFSECENSIYDNNWFHMVGFTAVSLYTQLNCLFSNNHIEEVRSVHGNGSSIYLSAKNLWFHANLVDTKFAIQTTMQDSGNIFFTCNVVKMGDLDDGIAYRGLEDNSTFPAGYERNGSGYGDVTTNFPTQPEISFISNTFLPPDDYDGTEALTSIQYANTTRCDHYLAGNIIYGTISRRDGSDSGSGTTYTADVPVAENNNILVGTGGTGHAILSNGQSNTLEATATTIWSDPQSLDPSVVQSSAADVLIGDQTSHLPIAESWFTALSGAVAIVNKDYTGQDISWTTAPVGAKKGPTTAGPAEEIVMGFQASQDEGTTFDLYVDNVNGSDANLGTSVGAAKATIQAAIDAATSNQTIGIRNQGTDYHEALDTYLHEFNNGHDNITLSGYGTEKPVIKGSVDLTGAVVCTVGDEPDVGPNYASIYKVTNVSKTNFVDDDPFNAALLEDDEFMTIAMGRQPNPRFRTNEQYNLDWLEAEETVVNGSNEILGHRLPAFTDRYTQAQIENCDVRFHREPNGATRTPVASFDTGTKTINLTDQTQTYESNIYKDRFALVNLVPAMQLGEWGFIDNGDGTVNLYFWPEDSANVNTAMEYCDIDTLLTARNATTNLRSLIFKNTSATQGVGSTTPIRMDSTNGAGDLDPFTMDNCWVRNSMNKGDGYGLLFSRKHNNYVVSQCTFENSRNAFGVFLAGGNYDTVDGRTIGGLFERNIIKNADKSPCRVYGHIDNIVARNHFLYSGLAAHANKCNHYEGGHMTLWAHNIAYGCSGYATWQEASSQDWIGNWFPCNFIGGRALVDQNRDSGFSSWATNQNINGDCYILNNEFAPSPSAINEMVPLAISALGNLPLETAVKFIVKNNILYGMDVTDEAQMVAEGNNYYTGATTRVGSDVLDDYGDVYEDILIGDFTVKNTSPTRSQAGASLSSIEGDDGNITLAARWPTYDFTKDINGDTWDIASPGVGPMTDPDNFPTFEPFWIERPSMVGAPTTGETITLTSGVLMTYGTRPTLTYQWKTATDPYAHPSTWTDILGATSSSFTVTAAQEGLYIGCEITGGTAVDQVIQTVVTSSAYPLSIGALLIEDHKDNTDQPANTWEESGTFITDGTPLLIVLPAHISAGTNEMSPEVTIGAQGRTNGTGTQAVMIADADIAQRSSNHTYLGIITNPGTGTMTLQYRSTTQETDSMGIYAWACPGLASFGAIGSLAGTTSGASLTTDVTTVNGNSIVLTSLARQAISGNPVADDTYDTSTTIMIQNGYSGQQENTNSSLFSLAYQLSPSTGLYDETITFGDTRASGMIMTELVGATAIQEPDAIYDAADLYEWWDGRTGVTTTGSDVDSWTSQSTTGTVVTEGFAEPTYVNNEYIQFADGVDDGLDGTTTDLSGLGTCDVFFRARLDAAHNFILATDGGNSSPHWFVGENGTTGTPVVHTGGTIYVDGVVVTNRGEMYSAMSDLNWHTIEVHGTNMATVDNFCIAGYISSTYNAPLSIAQIIIADNGATDAATKRADIKTFLDSLDYI